MWKLIGSIATLAAAAADVASDQMNGATCPALLPRPDLRETFTVGVLVNQGYDAAFARHNATFSEYLTETAGRRFDPPIRFEMRGVAFHELYGDLESGALDFVYVSPSPYACIEAEYGAQSLVSHVARQATEARVYELSQYAGVMFARAERYDINTVEDIQGQIVSAISISGFAAAQLQFREMAQRGLSYINDPRKLVFTNNQDKTVAGILSGSFDVGFVRTGILERFRDGNGDPLDLSLLKIINPQTHTLENGSTFPFVSSTQLYPEWNLAALTHVPKSVSEEVQNAMLALEPRAKAGFALGETDDAKNSSCLPDDTTPEVARIAATAMTNGKYAGFRTTLSYGEVSLLLHDNKFLQRDQVSKKWKCVRPTKLYDAIICPPGTFKKPQRVVEAGCKEAGIPCDLDAGEACVCSPCIKAFDVAIFPLDDDTTTEEDDNGLSFEESTSLVEGCPKMSLCGSVQQTKTITFQAIDYKERVNATLDVVVHEGSEWRVVPVKKVGDFRYNFSMSGRQGGLIFEISLNGEQISESPLRVEIVDRDCSTDYGDNTRRPDSMGECICTEDRVSIGEECVRKDVIYMSIFIPLAGIGILIGYLHILKLARRADTVWQIQPKDLKFDSPPTVVGQGSFGLVLLAEYRGTKCAVKRILPRNADRKSGSKESNRLPSNASNDSPNITRDASSGSGGSFEGIRNMIRRRQRTGLEIVTEENEQELTDPIEDAHEQETPAMFGAVTDMEASRMEAETSEMKKHGLDSFDARNISRLMDGTLSGRHCLADPSIKSRSLGIFQSKKSSTFLNFYRRGSYTRRKAEFIEEMRIISKLRHPCITTILGAVVSPGSEPMIVMELLQYGSLYDCIHNETLVFDGGHILGILRDIAQGIRFLHSAEPAIVHGDLKSANILIGSRFRAKVADFGLTPKDRSGVAKGTPYWMAPELLRGETGNTIESDMYAIGIILYEIYSRKSPYEGEHASEVLHLVADPKVNKRPPLPRSCPPKIAKLMKFLVLSAPNLRPNSVMLDHRLEELDVVDAEPGYEQRTYQMKKRAQQEEEHEQKKVQMKHNQPELLQQIFPKHVASILASGGKVEPQSHDIVSIFFADVVGFTTIASKLSPFKISDLLDRLYRKMDKSAKAREVFKVETVGDSWLGVTNLSGDQGSDHAKRVALFAIDAIQIANETLIDEENPDLGFVSIRCGIHSGPVVSNVIGSLNPRYGIFGDAVNVGARMESSSETGRIHCSERTHLLLEQQASAIPTRKRGLTNIKGKGVLTTYWVNELG